MNRRNRYDVPQGDPKQLVDISEAPCFRPHTTDLTLNVMNRVAERLDLNMDNDAIVEELYWVCCDLEDYPEDCGFGSSDAYSYIQLARRLFHIPAEK